jgi:uncharacterized protein (TIGR03790 family)
MSGRRVLVVYPTGVSDSKELANYYVQKRGIPATNVLGVSISMTPFGTYYIGEYQKFYGDLVRPIKAKLAQLGETNIDVILLVGAIPYEVRNAAQVGVSVDSTLMMLWSLDPNTNNIATKANPYFEHNPTVGADKGHFDHKTYKVAGNSEMYLVSRLSNADQIDHALYADRFLFPQEGYYNGYVYVDSEYGQGGNGNVARYTDEYLVAQPAAHSGNFSASEAEADMNIAFAEHYARQAGFPLKWENTTNGAEIGEPEASFSDGTSARTAPRGLFYGGWYNYNNYNDVWEWLPGSVACDLNSGPKFGREALLHGASAASYVIGEPYRAGHPRPDVLIYYLLNGYSFAEASTLATPLMGWMSVHEGDPLYTPTAPVLVTPTAEFPRTLVKDTSPPSLAVGSPVIAAGPEANDRIIQLSINDKAEPELAVAQVDYGTDVSYGNTAKSGQGYKRRLAVTLKNLQKNTLYHYRVTLKDPAGNVTVTGDYTFKR